MRVISAPLFGRRQRITVSGHGPVPETFTADGTGRVAFTVDLGPPAAIQQYRIPGALAAPRVTRQVDLSPAASR